MDAAGNTGFALLVVIFSLATYGLALSLESVTDKLFDRWRKFRARRKEKRIEEPIIEVTTVIDEESLSTKA